MTKSGHIFFSYRNLESEFAIRLAVDLKQSGLNLWVDRLESGIHVGDDWVQRLQSALNSCAGLIAVISPGYVESSYCRKELQRAVALGREVYPVLAASVQQSSWPFEIQGRQFIDFREWRNDIAYRERLKQLIETLQRDAREQFHALPDPETRYLLNLIAELEGRKGVLEYIDLRAESASERPNPRRDPSWPEEFAVLREHVKPAENRDSEPVLFNSIHQVAAQYAKFVLLGPSGAGKTTAIRRLALDGARRRLEAPQLAPLPLLLDLSRWTDKTEVVDFVRNRWPFASDASEAIRYGDVFLCLDGLNEMGAAGARNAEELKKWLGDSSGPSQVIVTCRDSSYTQDLDLNLPCVSIHELGADEVEAFAASYLGDEESERFLARLVQGNSGAATAWRPFDSLTRNPYLLTALIYL